MPKHEKNIRDIYIEQATKVARGIIQKTLGKNAGILGSDESVRDIIIKKLMEGFTNFGKTGGEKVKLYFGNYKKNPFTFDSNVVSQEERSTERFAGGNNTSSFGGSKKTTLSGKQSIKKRRKTKKQRGGNVNPILMVAEIADKVLIPLLFKIPLFITEIVIPIASAQMTKVISKYSAERTQLIVQFILNSVEINISRIANSEECKQSWEIFDQEIETVIDTLDINIEPDRTKKIVVGGGGDGTFPQLFADLITQSNPAGLSLSEQLFQIASKFPNVFNIINLIPKSVDEFFTIKMFDRILQEAICEEFNDIITGTESVITQFYTNIQSFPKSLTIKSGLVLKDFIKINGKPDVNKDTPDVNDNKAEVGLDYNKFMSKMEGFPNTNP
jgi:hypothetical protein